MEMTWGKGGPQLQSAEASRQKWRGGQRLEQEATRTLGVVDLRVGVSSNRLSKRGGYCMEALVRLGEKNVGGCWWAEEAVECRHKWSSDGGT